MKVNKKNAIANALDMIIINRKKYLFLSVTVIISFTAFLVYLIYTDSKLFHTYKEEIRASSYVGIIYCNEEVARTELVLEQLEKIEDTYYYEYETQHQGMWFGEDVASAQCEVQIVPSDVWGFFYSSTRRLELVDGTKSFHLEKGQVIINESYYNLVKDNADENGKIYVEIPVTLQDGRTTHNKYEVVGVCKDRDSASVSYGEKGEINVHVQAFASISNFEDTGVAYVDKHVAFYSKNIRQVVAMLDNMKLGCDSAYEAKCELKGYLQDAIEVKMTIAIALFFLLAINLYSSFNNTLNERKFEIGVRRAIGARKRDIVLQFFLESFFVMLINLLLSLLAATILLSVYKVIQFYIYKTVWIIDITPYSMGIFLCCSCFLAIIFSVLFAVKSTTVEVAQHLKCE